MGRKSNRKRERRSVRQRMSRIEEVHNQLVAEGYRSLDITAAQLQVKEPTSMTQVRKSLEELREYRRFGSRLRRWWDRLWFRIAGLSPA